MTDPDQQKNAPSENLPVKNTAPLGRRLVSIVIDFFIINLLAGYWLNEQEADAIFNEVLQHLGAQPPTPLPVDLMERLAHLELQFIIAFAATFFIVNGYLLISRGQTIGKWLMNIAIRNLENEKPSLLALVLNRYLLQVFMFGLPLLLLIDYLCIFVRSDRRSLHDLFARTKVIDLAIPVVQSKNTFTA